MLCRDFLNHRRGMKKNMNEQLNILSELGIETDFCTCKEPNFFYRDWGNPYRHLNYSLCLKCGKRKKVNSRAKSRKITAQYLTSALCHYCAGVVIFF
jgi:hypothetical protein